VRFDSGSGVGGEHEASQLAGWHTLAKWRQGVLDPGNRVSLPKRQLIRLSWTRLEGQAELGGQGGLVLEDVPDERDGSVSKELGLLYPSTV